MKKGLNELKGFRDYSDYQNFAEVYLYWQDKGEHKKTYDLLIHQQDRIAPISHMLKMNKAAQERR